LRLTLEFDVAVDYPLLVEIAHRTYELGEDPPKQRRTQQFTACAGHVEEVAPGTVAEHQNGPGGFYAPGFQVDKGGVIDGLHDFQLALEAHLDAVLGRAALGAGFANLDGDQGPSLVARARLRSQETGGPRRVLLAVVVGGAGGGERRYLAGG